MKRTSPPSPTSKPPTKRERSQENKSQEKHNDPFKMFKGESGPVLQSKTWNELFYISSFEVILTAVQNEFTIR